MIFWCNNCLVITFCVVVELFIMYISVEFLYVEADWCKFVCQQKELWFEQTLKEKRGFIIKRMGEDGACLFRSVGKYIFPQNMWDSVGSVLWCWATDSHWWLILICVAKKCNCCQSSLNHSTLSAHLEL